eukprot:gnl/MRDRNA2_/MRDRNA2_45381_c0_seq2.p1 gnl/MRDRNA2_/MRDRNA2_45381_c0~~gnl/MRDRNA2_/MRDRNA2_45381_c0_seq2.p1  ORF type:complete len:323 (+),score=50.20 gnl/MRDRNA2_/MRDRNA2_45381_c0_seq2:151-1119(+)
MSRWRPQLTMRSTLLMFLLLGHDIVDCHAKLVSARQLRGKTDFRKANELMTIPKKSAFGVFSRKIANAHAARARRLLSRTVVPVKTPPFIVPALQRSFYKGLFPFKGFPNFHHVDNRGLQVFSEPQVARVVDMSREVGTHWNVTMAEGPNTTAVFSLFGVGGPEAIVIFVVALSVFGPQGLAAAAKQLGSTLKGLQPTIREIQEVSKEFQGQIQPTINEINSIQRDLQDTIQPLTDVQRDFQNTLRDSIMGDESTNPSGQMGMAAATQSVATQDTSSIAAIRSERIKKLQESKQYKEMSEMTVEEVLSMLEQGTEPEDQQLQ